MTEQSATLADEMKRLAKEIKALDKAVAEATEQRKEEHGEFITFQTENNAALQLIEKAKNKLFKFYRPNQYKEAPKRELTEEEKILAASGRSDMIATAAPEMIAGTSIAAFAQVHQRTAAAPPPPPATWDAYQKKDGKSNVVIALMDMLMKELQDGITEAENEEKTAQTDYERLMSESQESRATMVQSVTTKEVAKADLDTKIEARRRRRRRRKPSSGRSSRPWHRSTPIATSSSRTTTSARLLAKPRLRVSTTRSRCSVAPTSSKLLPWDTP